MSLIDDISRRSREQILAKVSAGYTFPDFKAEPLPDPVRHIRFVHTGETPEQVAAYTESEAAAAATNLGDSTRDLLTTFKANAEANKFVVHDVTAKNLVAEINNVLQTAHTNSLMYPQNLGLDIDKLQVKERRCFDRSIDEPDMREAVFHTDASIINCELGVASHGVVMVCSSSTQPRLLSLAMPTCIMLLPKSKIVAGLLDGIRQVKATYPVLPTNILYIAGPSRTSDIELITVFGVHGPQQVHLMLY